MAEDDNGKGGILAAVVICFIMWAISIGALVFLLYRWRNRKSKTNKENQYLPSSSSHERLRIKEDESSQKPLTGEHTNNGLISHSKTQDKVTQPKTDIPDLIRSVPPKPAKPPLQTKPDFEGENYYNLPDRPTVVPLSELPELVKNRKKEEHPFKDEFDKLVADKDQVIPWKYAEQEDLKSQNRFKNIIPYDHTRVPLKKRNGEPLSDYINASFIHGYHRENEYIACHGPVERTMPGVWRMMWEYKVPTIIMVTNLTESSTMKINCEQYWPKEGSKTYGLITVTMNMEDVYPDYVHRQFTMNHSEEEGSRVVTHYHYTAWPDHGVPSNTGTLLKIRRLTKQSPKSTSPVVVHCRAGIGRTGTFVAMDYLLEEAADKKQIDVFSCVNKMRKQRINMVQTLVQYAFLYDVLNSSTTFGDTNISDSNFHEYFQKSSQGTPSQLEKQFALLEECKPVFSIEGMEEAQAERNKHKNRDPKVLPVSRYRVFFTSMRDGSNPYFNAVPVKGYKAEYSTYATQVPLQATVPLFWKFVLESKFKSIVCLQNSTDGVEWFPKKEPQIQADSISITTTGETEKSDIKMYDLRILDQTDSGSETEAVYSNMSPQDMGQGEAAEVRLFMPQNWADQPLTKRPAYRLMNLREEVIRWQGQKDDLPVLVVCRNGAYETGLYVAFNYLLDMLNCEHEVDVTQVVKQIRVTRPQFIASKEQYHFLHSMISDVAPNNTYSNT